MKNLQNYIILFLVFSFSQLNAQSGLSEAEDFSVKDVTGEMHFLSSYLEQGKIVVLPFFTTTCGSCNIYTPEIVLSHQDFGCNQGDVFFLGINWGANNIGVTDFISAHAVGYPCASGTQGTGNEVNELYEIASHITCLVIMPDGEIAGQFYGPNAFPTRDSLNSLLLSLGAELYDCSVGTSELNNQRNRIEISPNPVNQHTNLYLEVEFSGSFKIELLNISGQILNSFPIYLDSHQQIIKLNLEAYSEGLYFIQIRHKSQIIASEKLVKI
ncbi:MULTISPECIES: T9SS type A sorting domain-containing protein [unclassified Lentimicrobium]|uniref:T9SS type A sorting domain-containing protein n=1 Tax=unclassified Lentimicrobium TaxID=2677434 RepID=UPI001554F056|nr:MULTISPECIES: T9SS type A sorting domain-containing protein [unclassified Lentimicrobium]NPD44739.1 T9SS type A sorting domain-containing protein [Lentimicrobium sp. S6]NPD83405.1 T9SS type A sorting domain-containing protein [Lentimicrobium sp. L6]